MAIAIIPLDKWSAAREPAPDAVETVLQSDHG
jgi:hypothetical protein